MPVAGDGFDGDLEDLGGFLDGEAAEVAEFDDLACAWVVGGEPREGVFEGEEFFGLEFGEGNGVREGEFFPVAAAFDGAAFAGVVHEDFAHDAGGGAEEFGAAFPGDWFGDEAEPGFVDEGGGLEGMVGAFAAHGLGGDAVQLALERFENAIAGLGVAFGRLRQEDSDVGQAPWNPLEGFYQENGGLDFASLRGNCGERGGI
jgi:hypothetical protein